MTVDVILAWCGPGLKEPPRMATTVEVPELTPVPQIYDAARVKLGVFPNTLDSNWVGFKLRVRA